MKNLNIPYIDSAYPKQNRVDFFLKYFHFSLVFSVAIMAVLVILSFFYETHPVFLNRVLVTSMYAGLTAVLLFSVLKLFEDDNKSDFRIKRLTSAKSSIEEIYGLELSDKEFASLNYPDKKPTNEAQILGSFTRQLEPENNEKIVADVYMLYSEGGTLQLKRSTRAIN